MCVYTYTYNFIVLPMLLLLYCCNLLLIIIIIIQRLHVYPDPGNPIPCWSGQLWAKHSALLPIKICSTLHYVSHQYRLFGAVFVLRNIL